MTGLASGAAGEPQHKRPRDDPDAASQVGSAALALSDRNALIAALAARDPSFAARVLSSITEQANAAQAAQQPLPGAFAVSPSGGNNVAALFMPMPHVMSASDEKDLRDIFRLRQPEYIVGLLQPGSEGRIPGDVEVSLPIASAQGEWPLTLPNAAGHDSYRPKSGLDFAIVALEVAARIALIDPNTARPAEQHAVRMFADYVRYVVMMLKIVQNHLGSGQSALATGV
jgi:hypothetical protein